MANSVDVAAEQVGWISDREGLGAAVRAAHELVEQMPDASRAHAVLGEYLLYSGDWDESERALARGLELNPDCPHCLGVQATFAAFNCDPERAMSLYERAKALAPRSPDTLLAGINAFTVAKDPKASLACAETLYGLDPNRPTYWAALLAGIYATKDTHRADKLLTKGSKHMHGYSTYHVWMARYWMRRQQMKEAEKAALRAVDLAPMSENAWTAYAQSLEYQGKVLAAKEAASRAVSLNPRSTVALRSLSRIAEVLGNEEEAREFGRRADYAVPALARHAKLYPLLNLIKDDDIQAAYDLACATEAEAPADFCESLRGTLLFLCAELEKWEELETRLAKAERSAFDADCYLAQARLLAHRGNLAAATQAAEDGHNQFPSHAELHAVWIGLLAQTGQNELLTAVATDLAENTPGSPASAATLIQALADAGFRKHAYQLLNRSLEAFPESGELAMTLFVLALDGEMPMAS